MANSNLTILTEQITEADYSFNKEDLQMIRFMNFGQNFISLDHGNVVIQPGEAYVEGDTNGPGIDHSYRIEFVTNPGTPPDVDGVTCKAANFLQVRVYKRSKNA